ncbi:hypothetical protein B0T26DRAFT_697939 [Lasiosphaeria miniovina]|uniref:Uncharacterized protein n=1 Tax=Lasiosphaeria miniovina TaxID=1954250 RepID=A0AA40E902_9PEZI|nr:uncharacterized protein B0T26DRAFT_697939 [Lasiosphaeria miniovina]KAK0728436.1 hypothetical protein B0T26DRAFT_697939 [Lasiosphaeria miniovina]
MDPPAKKRSIFGFSNIFRSAAPASPAPVTNIDSAGNAGGGELVALPRVEPSSASAPESPAKRASDSQLASRKIHGRPQGPASKLSQTMNASDFSRPSANGNKMSSFSSSVAAMPRRMPGDNPNKPSPFASSTMSHAPTQPYKTTNFSGAATTPRNIFRSSELPPNTPGRVPRGSTADVNGRGLNHTASTELFKMRIPSPPRHLTGEMLAKEVPEDSGRTGSVYADEFLAHYCPPDLDDQQRRQFFCILDLRRLKYAANEVFAKKDWKINVMNFAKEYEKSRSLIMLRYGLYEFKTVRASESVKKEWKQKHGIPSSDDEAERVPSFKANGGSKRKADVDLTPNDTALTASSSNGNKRTRAPEVPPVFSKNKRKADGEPDENQPAKLFRPSTTSTPQKTPSATKSVFESIANNAISSTTASTTPAKSTAKNSVFGSIAGPKLSNGNLGRSILETSSHAPSATSNIFSHLSDASKGSSGKDADSEGETSTNADEEEEEESELQRASPSDDQSAAASVEVSTPQFGTSMKPTVTDGTSSSSSDAGEASQAQGRSIFDRITRGSDGQPVRKLAPEEGNAQLFAPASDRERSVSPVKEQPASPAAPPANNTWNTSTPIKFSAPAPTLFSASAVAKPATSSAISFGAPATLKKDEPSAPQEAPKTNLFGAQPKASTEPSAAAQATPKVAPAPSAFSFPSKSTDTPSAPPVFGKQTPSASTGSQLFGSSTPAFGQPKEKSDSKEPDATPAPATSVLFGVKPAAAALEASKPASVFQSSTLFGAQSKLEDAKPPQAQPENFFGKAPAESTPKQASIFAAPSSTASIFSALSNPPASAANEPAAKKPAFGTSEAKLAGASLFGFPASTPAALGAGKPATPSATNSFFGASTTPAAPVPETKNMFGATSGQASNVSDKLKPLFGSTPAQTTQPSLMFGASTPAATPAPSGSIFGFNSSQTPAPSQPAASQPIGSLFGTGGGASFTFSAGGTDNNIINNPFASNGNASAPTSFNFGSGSNDGGSQSSSFQFGANAPAPNATQQNTQQSNIFGLGPSKPLSSTPVFSGGLAPGGGTSTGTSTSYQPLHLRPANTTLMAIQIPPSLSAARRAWQQRQRREHQSRPPSRKKLE